MILLYDMLFLLNEHQPDPGPLTLALLAACCGRALALSPADLRHGGRTRATQRRARLQQHRLATEDRERFLEASNLRLATCLALCIRLRLCHAIVYQLRQILVHSIQ